MISVVFYFATPGSDPTTRAAMLAGRIGWMDSPAQGNKRPPQVMWAADSGCFNADRYPGDEAWLRWLRRSSPDARACGFATAPDVVGSHTRTLARSVPWLPVIRNLGYRAAFVAQNGACATDLPWDEFDVVFLGGTLECRECGLISRAGRRAHRHEPCPECGRVLTEWKLGPAARDIVSAAKVRGVSTHLGRANSLRRLRYAAEIGIDSADGTFLTFAPSRNITRLLTWLDVLDGCPRAS